MASNTNNEPDEKYPTPKAKKCTFLPNDDQCGVRQSFEQLFNAKLSDNITSKLLEQQTSISVQLLLEENSDPNPMASPPFSPSYIHHLSQQNVNLVVNKSMQMMANMSMSPTAKTEHKIDKECHILYVYNLSGTNAYTLSPDALLLAIDVMQKNKNLNQNEYGNAKSMRTCNTDCIYITYCNHKDAHTAFRALDGGQDVDGHTMYVKKSCVQLSGTSLKNDSDQLLDDWLFDFYELIHSIRKKHKYFTSAIEGIKSQLNLAPILSDIIVKDMLIDVETDDPYLIRDDIINIDKDEATNSLSTGYGFTRPPAVIDSILAMEIEQRNDW